MRQATRRELLKSFGGALAAPAILTARPRARRLPIVFSTLGCPEWSWKTILDHAREWGYAAIELRGIQGEMDLTKRPEFSETGWRQSLRDLTALGLGISDLGSSARMHEPEASVRAAQMDEAKRFIDLARRLKARYVRVFGDRFVKGEPREATIDRVVAGLHDLALHAQGSGVGVIIESHGDFTDSPTLLQILKAVNHPDVGLLWDAHHTIVAGKEKPADTLMRLGAYVRHTHLKDSVPSGNEVRYVLPGAGKVPLREIIALLVKQGYREYYSFEWEKAWHPEIEEPEIAFPRYAKVVGQYLIDAGVKPEY